MKISALIAKLNAISAIYGDISVTGGSMSDDTPLSDVSVTDTGGMEVWPTDPNGARGQNAIDGVFFQ
jgi:hypothetical protein